MSTNLPQEMSRHHRLAAAVFFGGLGLAIAGGISFVYAHDHDPRPEADPMAVHLLSRTAYERLHYGGIVAMLVGMVLMLVGLVAVIRST
jgi:hypothetical protein